jgi:hypothetical protein
MNPRSFIAALLVATAGANQLNAATVQFILCNDRDAAGTFAPGQFRITAKVSLGDNGGLSGYGMDLLGGILTLDNRSPRDVTALTSSQDGPTGFTLSRSADNVIPRFITGYQDSLSEDAIMVYGFGQQANSFANLGISVGGSTLEQPAWDAELLLATGTYVGVKPSFNPVSPHGTANVFVNSTTRQVKRPEHIERFVCPEPTTVGLTVAMLLGLPKMRRANVLSASPSHRPPPWSVWERSDASPCADERARQLGAVSRHALVLWPF